MNDAIDALLAAAAPAADSPMLTDLPQAAPTAHVGEASYADDVQLCSSCN